MTEGALRGLCIVETIGLGGGAERLVVSLAPALRERGVTIEVVELFGWDRDIGFELERNGFTVHRLNLQHRWAMHEALPALRRLIRSRQPDFLWGHLFFGNLYGMVGRLLTRPAVPCVITLHNAHRIEEPPPGLRSRANLFAERVLGQLVAEKRVAVSHAVADAYARNFGWTGMDVAQDGVPVKELLRHANRGQEARMKTRARLGVADSEFVITVPSRFVPVKGHAYLLRALKILRDRRGTRPRLLAPGEGPTLPDLRREARELGLDDQVIFLPLLPQEELFELFSASDAVVLPSLSEAFGIAAAEAMVFGKPLILSQVPGLMELAGTPPCAAVAPPGDPEGLANAIHAIVSDPARASELALAGRKRVAALFDISVCADRWVAIFRSTSRPRRAHPKQPRASEASP
jgi:glycosyltransferase involved in cell wall biosynthesis